MPDLRDEILSLFHLYHMWGVDYTLADAPFNHFFTPAPRPPSRSTDAASSVAVADAPALASVPSIIDQLAKSVGALARMATHTLYPQLVDGAPLLLIGEIPDTEEDRSGMLWAGRSGALLDSMLTSIGLARYGISQIPTVPWRPPGERNLAQTEIRHIKPALEQLIALSAPKVVAIFGASASKILFGANLRTAQARGKWHNLQIEGQPSLPTLVLRHPLQLFSSAHARRDMWHDLLLLHEKLISMPSPPNNRA